MYTVIIAEDEEETRRGIVERIDWEKIGFRVIGEATDGEEALEQVENLKPDLVITDIKMPFLTGIELARRVREVRPATWLAFLSGYSDFMYAQEAIKYNVASYMLKPITAVEMTEELHKIKEKMDRYFEKFISEEEEAEKLGKTEFMMPLLLDSFTKETEEKLQERAVNCGFLSQSNNGVLQYAVLVVSIEDSLGSRMMQKKHMQAVDGILDKYFKHYISRFINGRSVMLLAGSKRDIEKYVHILVEEIMENVEKNSKFKCRVGVSRSAAQLSQCRECYLEAVNAVSYLAPGHSGIYFIQDMEKITEKEGMIQADIQRIPAELESMLRGQGIEAIDKYLEKIERGIWGGERKSNSGANAVLVPQMFASIYKVAYATLGDGGLAHMEEQYPFGRIKEAGHVAENFKTLREMSACLKELMQREQKKGGEIASEQVLEIVETRYMDEALSVPMICTEIGVSSNYLCTLIKKTTGSTFVELLREKRISKAKELLENTSMRINEIADQCGFHDQYYFSHCFKKVTGISPLKYRRDFEERE